MPYKDRDKLSLYKTWHAMIARCHNKKSQSYKWYGARGISVCDRWRESFDAFAEDMGPRPRGMQLDRRNNDLNYDKSNCRWATVSQQQGNKRKWAFRKTHCNHGHELTESNSCFWRDGTRMRRHCRICERIRRPPAHHVAPV